MSEPVHDAQRLKELQALPLDRKIQISQARIIEWYTRNKGNVVVSFSGGKDSTVLLHLVRSLFPDVRAVFSNTGLEYPEIQRFVRSVPNVTIVAPKVSFHEVLSTCGYPLIGKEVAEAIYYARRLRSQNLNVEREREREQERRNAVEAGRALRLPENERGGTSGTSDENSSEPGHFIDTSGAKNRRTVLTGKWGGGQPGCSCKGNSQGGYLETDRRRKDCLGLWQTDNLQANRTWGGRAKARGRETTPTSERGSGGTSTGDDEPG